MTDPAPARPAPAKALLVTHTHWDREWYQPLEQTRFRLVDLFDRLLDILNREPDYHSFWLDGQTIPVEDYAEARPERMAELAERLRQNRIQIGPWYVLADEFLVSGEACLRNLLLGRRACRAAGQDHRIGYAPDTFGHIDQFPQILRGFGIDNAVFWRGYALEQLDAAETLWTGRDGTTVRALCLVSGYSNARGLTADLDTSADRLDGAIETLRRYCASGTLLLMNGIDHALPLPGVADLTRKLELRYPGLAVRHGDLAEYLRLIADHHAGHKPLRGELFHVPALDGCLSNRPVQKRLNRLLENRLAHYAEPLALLASRSGEAVPPGLLDRAWRLLVQCHPHDTICGCHADAVARDLEARLHGGLQIAAEAESRALAALLGVYPGAGLLTDPCRIAVYNPLPWTRDDTIELDLPLPADARDIRLVDAQGAAVPVRLLAVRPGCHSSFSEYRIPRRTRGLIARIRFEARALAPMAVTLFEVQPADENRLDVMDTGSRTGAGSAARSTGRRPEILENDCLRATVHEDGSLDLLDKRSGTCLAGLNRLQIQEDRGDLYRFAPSLDGAVTAAPAGTLTRTDDTPERQAVRIDTAIPFQGQSLRLRIAVALPGHGTRLEVAVSVEHDARGFRLQAAFPIPSSGTALVQTPFSLSPRTPVQPAEFALPARGERVRLNAASQPMQALALFALENGMALALANRGLYEYTWEHRDRPCLTLMRAVGTITALLAEHTAEGGHAPGAHTFDYALAVQPADAPHLALREAMAFALPASATVLFSTPTRAPDFGFAFDQPCWMPAAFKRAEEGSDQILRFWNASERPETGEIRLPPGRYTKAVRARLDETPLAPLAMNGERVALTAGPFEIVTLRLS